MRKFLAFLWRPKVAFFGPLVMLALYLLLVGPYVWAIWNLHLPRWIALPAAWTFSPVEWVFEKSVSFRAIANGYVNLWVDFRSGRPATTGVEMLDTPPYAVDVFGTLIGAWSLWQFIHWINQLKAPTAA